MCRRNVGESLAVDRSVVKAVPLTLKETMPSAGPRRSIFSETMPDDVQSRRSEVNRKRLDSMVCVACERQTWTVNVNTTLTGASLPAHNTQTLHDPIRDTEHTRARGVAVCVKWGVNS